MNVMKMTKLIPVRRLLRLTVLAALPLLPLSDWLSAGPFPLPVLCAELFVLCALLLFYPLPRESPLPSLFAFVLVLATAVALTLGGAGPPLRVLAVSLLLSVYILFRGIRLFAELVCCKIGTALVRMVEMCAKLLYANILLSVGLLLAACPAWPPGKWIVLIALLVLFPLLYLRAYSGRTLFVSDTYIKLLKELARRAPACARPVSAREENKLSDIYNKAVQAMEKGQPYLDEAFNLAFLARLVGTNESYLSRAVNDYFGNFKRFVNNYRVEYAVARMKENPQVKIRDLSVLCGFRTIVSFDMAFKYIMHTTPSEYCRELTAGRLE